MGKSTHILVARRKREAEAREVAAQKADAREVIDVAEPEVRAEKDEDKDE